MAGIDQRRSVEEEAPRAGQKVTFKTTSGRLKVYLIDILKRD